MSVAGDPLPSGRISELRGKVGELALLNDYLGGVQALLKAVESSSNIDEALERAAADTEDPDLREAFRRAAELVRHQEMDLGSALAHTDFFPDELMLASWEIPKRLVDYFAGEIQRTRNEITDLAVDALLVLDERVRRLEAASRS